MPSKRTPARRLVSSRVDKPASSASRQGGEKRTAARKAGTARLVTLRCHRRLPLLADPAVATDFVRRLKAVLDDASVDVIAWVVLPDHVHLVVAGEAPEASLETLKRDFAAHWLAHWRKKGAGFAERLRDEHGGERVWQATDVHPEALAGAALRDKIIHCHRNPIGRGLASRTAEWAWSSARAYETRGDYAGPAIAFERVPAGPGSLT